MAAKTKTAKAKGTVDQNDPQSTAATTPADDLNARAEMMALKLWAADGVPKEDVSLPADDRAAALADDRERYADAMQRLIVAGLDRDHEPTRDELAKAITAAPWRPILAGVLDHIVAGYILQTRPLSTRPKDSSRHPFEDLAILSRHEKVLAKLRARRHVIAPAAKAIIQTAADMGVSKTTVQRVLTESRARHPQRETPKAPKAVACCRCGKSSRDGLCDPCRASEAESHDRRHRKSPGA